MRRIVFSCLFIPLLYSSSLMAINKCVDGNGRISFQDTPCVGAASASTVVTQPAPKTSDNGVKIVDLNVGKNKQFSIGLPSEWNTTVKTPPGIRAPTLRAQPKTGSDLVLLMTFIPDQRAFFGGPSILPQVMSEIERNHQTNPNEQKLASSKIEQIIGKESGELITYLDKSLSNKASLPKGEFMIVSEGAVIIDKVIVKITILTNDVRSPNYKKAFAAIHAIISKKNA
ncbi:MAG: DUF4124 domain-containing protein [Pseudomonadales bacterium]|nr:DUF4124 domain-containing protein [Pseudomonadales bacterium]